MKEGMGWGLFLVALVVILYMYFSKKPININMPPSEADDDDTVKCELKDAYGRTVTITGDPNDMQFQRMCQLQTNQQVYVYGYPYTFIRFWRRKPSPPPPPPPAPPAP